MSPLFDDTISAPQDAIDHAAKHEVGKYGENCPYHHCFGRIDPALDDDLVDHVDNDRHNEDPANVLPAFTKEARRVYRIFHYRPEIRRSAISRVHHPGANCKETCDERLNDQPESKWRMHAAGYVGPYANERV